MLLYEKILTLRDFLKVLRYSGHMNHALILNFLIALAVIIALVITSNPVVLLGLLMLKEMPYGLLTMETDEEMDEQGRPIGFVHHDEK
jgi:hypothetical protein